MPSGVHSSVVSRFGIRRMCVGCRERADVSELIRVVASSGAVVPDARRRLPGRGAHLHPNQRCLDRAERSKAFARALRVAGPLDLGALRDWVTTTTQ